MILPTPGASCCWRVGSFLCAALLLPLAASLSTENNNRGASLFGFQGPGYNFLPPPPLQPRAQELLTQLALESSTKPALAKAPASQIQDLLTASAPLALRAASGVFGLNYQLQWVPRDDSQYAYLATARRQVQETCFSKAPPQPIVLYDVEPSGACRQVREACSLLSLTVRVRPTPRNGILFEKTLREEHGAQAPFLVDPNTSVSMAGAGAILKYLFLMYGTGDANVPWPLAQAVNQNDNGNNNPFINWSTLSTTVALNLARWNKGGTYSYSNPPPLTVDGQPSLTLWAYEGSPYCKLCREVLSEMELEHTIVYTPRGSPNRARLWQTMGRFQVPFLTDDATGVQLFESAAIIEYLQKQYGVAQSPVQFM